ncbi:hypothetical protein [Streptosporangium sp. KLBMP 9127]
MTLMFTAERSDARTAGPRSSFVPGTVLGAMAEGVPETFAGS